MRHFIYGSLSRVLVRYNHQLTSSAKAPEIARLTVVLGNKQTARDRELTIDTHSLPLTETSLKRTIIAEKEASDTDRKISLPPSLQYVRDLMDHYRDHVVLTQMGSFYELYFEQATKYAPKLNLSLTNRHYSYGKVPFAGFPVQQLSRHLKVLVNTYGYSVTIAEQFKRETPADNEVNRFYRRVTRIVTPGTFIDEAFENLQENTYLLSIEFPENCVEKLADTNTKLGLCWCDISTGEIFVQQVLLKDLISAITRIQPREILLEDSLSIHNIESGAWYSELVELKKYFIKYQKLPMRHRTMDSFYRLFSAGVTEKSLNQLKINLQEFTQKELAALRNTLIYVSEHLPDFSMNFQLPQRQLTGSIMQIDSRTSTALELHSTVRDNRKKGTLLSTIRRTVTPSGTRLLSQWLSGPSLDLREIKKRQRIVTFFRRNMDVTDRLVSFLKVVYDLPRIIQKFSFGKGDALELIQLARSLKVAIEVRTFLQMEASDSDKITAAFLKSMTAGLEFELHLIDDVIKYLNEDQIMKSQSNEEEEEASNEVSSSNIKQEEIAKLSVWVVNPSYSQRLQQLHEEYEKLWGARESLSELYENVFIRLHGAKNVSLKQKQNGEYALHIVGTSGNLKKINEFVKSGGHLKGHPFHILQQSSQTRWLSHKLWTDFGYELEVAVLKIKKEEARILNYFKEEFIKKSEEIRIIADTLGYLDALSSFAILAKEKNLVCPKVDRSDKLEIIGGRHLMVEDGISNRSLEKFTENDCCLESGHLWVITGPNMGGKSTYLRQNAIIVLLAQMGSYVPCSAAHIGLVDKIFSRVGSADDLYNEMSTFMVEMIETSFILRGATSKSLAILDEIGRGTSGKEGVSIAYATLKYLIEQNRCRSLFATHFGQELHQIIEEKCALETKQKIQFYKSGIVETTYNDFFYDHKLKPGICTKSDAVRVAKTAGFPEKALQSARELLS